MNCNKIQEFIITDYIDGQMGDKQKNFIDQHLAQCPACAGYLSSIKKAAVNPFVDISKDVPDQPLWARIRQSIEEDQQQQLEESLKPNFWERLISLVHIPRPAFALATVATVVLMVGITSQFMIDDQTTKINAQDQAIYLSSLIDEPVDMNNGNESQTSIERVFL